MQALVKMYNSMISSTKFPAYFSFKSPDEVFNLLIQECKCLTDSKLTAYLRSHLERFSRQNRGQICERTKDGVTPLFIACRRGNAEIVEYLVTACGVDIEQRALYEVSEDHSVHCVTPLWCAAVSGKLSVVKTLIRLGAKVNALSDSGSTPVRSACYMTNMEIVQYLVEHGADITKPNYNGGTCLINAVQSVYLCNYLIAKGANVNAKDIQGKTALHYAIQEHRLETTRLLIENGADPFAKSRCGDDALQTACLKGAHQIFEYLKEVVNYSAERLADAYELIGSTYLDEHNETHLAITNWRLAHCIRISGNEYIPKRPEVPKRQAYNNSTEFVTLHELNNIATDVDLMRIQSLLICERVLGINHKDTLFKLMYRGASYADSLQFQRCINLWQLSLKTRVEKHSILYTDTCFNAQAIVRLMLDLQEKYLNVMPNEFHENDLPLFKDVFSVFLMLTENIEQTRNLLTIRPVHRKQQENFDRILKCITHLIYLLVSSAKTEECNNLVYEAVKKIINIRSSCTNDSLLHLSVSRLNVIKSGYFTDDNNLRDVFPNKDVVKLLIKCGAHINARNESKSTPLHVASAPYNYQTDLVYTLLKNGAHLDLPNRLYDRPYYQIVKNTNNNIPLMKFITLKCLAANEIVAYRIPYKNQIPKSLELFVKEHENPPITYITLID